MKEKMDLRIYLFKVNLPRKKLKKLGINKYTGIIKGDTKFCVIPETYNHLGYTIYMMKDLFVCSVANEDGSINLTNKELWNCDQYREVLDEFEDLMLDNKHVDYDDEEIYEVVNIDNRGEEPFNKYKMKNGWSGEHTTPKIRNSRTNNVIKAYNLTYRDLFKGDKKIG